MHNTNKLLKWLAIPVIILILYLAFFSGKTKTPIEKHPSPSTLKSIKNTASNDSAAESLDTLTAELTTTKQQITQVAKDNQQLKQQNKDLLEQLHSKTNETTAQLTQDVTQLKDQLNQLHQNKTQSTQTDPQTLVQPIMTVTDVSGTIINSKNNVNDLLTNSAKNTLFSTTSKDDQSEQRANKKPPIVPYYTIPPNATGVKVRLMTALVGRIPIKGVVVDPYPFKLVMDDDTLAANGLRVPHLRQMVVSGYCEGDLDLSAVRGWVTSLTFVFDDGTISSTTSNDNNIGHFTKENALGYLTDAHGNPIVGQLISNAPLYLTGNVALGAAEGYASAFAQSQTTNSSSIIGTMNSSVTGSPMKYAAGEAATNGLSAAQQWWHDRQEQSFDAIFVSPVDSHGNFREITVNFSKEIDIDHNPTGRKIDYANATHTYVKRTLD